MRFIPLTYDALAKFFFQSDKVIVTAFLNAALNAKIDDYDVLPSEPRNDERVGEYHITTDILLSVTINNKKYIVNFEITRNRFKYIQNKSLYYLGRFITMRIAKGEDVNKPPSDIVQFNLSAVSGVNDVPKREVRLVYDNGEIFTNNVKLCVINLDKCTDMYYNGDVSDDIAFFSALDGKSFDDVDQKLKGRVPDKNRIEFMRSYKRMCSNKEIISQYEKDILDREAYKMMLEDAMNDAKIEGHAAGREEGLEKGREEGFAKGIAEGIEQNTIKMVSEMIQQNIPYDTISKVSGLTNEKIIEIEKSIGN